MVKVYYVRESYWQKFTGIGSNSDENLTTNEVCRLLNELQKKSEDI